MTQQVEELRKRLAVHEDLRTAAALLEWDQQTMMPPSGAEGRADSLATLQRMSHGWFIDDTTGELLDQAADALDGSPADSDDASLVRVTRRAFDKARRVPADLAAELAHAASSGQEAWIKARATSDFASFAPYLEHNLDLARQYVSCFDEFDCRYDALLDDYDAEMTTVQVSKLFDELRSQLVPMIATLTEYADRVDNSVLHGDFPVDKQRKLVLDTVTQMGFTREGWRMDDTVHPFATGIGAHDVRITTRWDTSFFQQGLYGAMHECGHGLYEDGIAADLFRSPLGHGASLSVHESQSRLWENMVGRGRAYCDVLASRVSDTFGGSVEPDVLFRAVNRIEPSHVRVEADEATYGLHIVLRFELEQELIEGRLPVADLPAAWNERFQRYLGIPVPNDALGVLQDVHWSAGLIGYFPTYALGNLIAGQLWQRVNEDIPELDQQLATGDLGQLREWLRENIHRHGAKFTTDELLHRVVGSSIEVGPFVSYLKQKLSGVYGVEL